MNRISRLLLLLLLAGSCLGTVRLRAQGPDGPIPSLTDAYVIRSWESEREAHYPAVMSIAQSPDGFLWIGSYSDLVRFDGRRFTLFVPQWVDPALGESVHSLCPQAPDSLWVGTDNGILRMGRTGSKVYGEGLGVAKGLVHSLVQEGSGQMLAVLESSLMHLEADRWVEDVLEPELRGASWRLLVDGDGVAYAWSKVGFLTRKDGVWKRVPLVPLGAPVTRLYVDTRGTLWLGCSYGPIGRWRDGTVRWLTPDDGVPVDGVFSMMDDGVGGLWIGAPDAIGRITVASVEELEQGRSRRLERWRFGKPDGVPVPNGREYAYPNTMRDASGRVWFATLDGLAEADPKRIRGHRTNGVPIFDSIGLVTGEEQMIWGSTAGLLRLQAGTRDVRIRYTAAQLGDPEQTEFEYRIGTGEWLSGPEDRQIQIVDLKPGEHVVALRSRMALEPDWSLPVELHFEIDWSWWELPGFRWTLSMLSLADWVGREVAPVPPPVTRVVGTSPEAVRPPSTARSAVAGTSPAPGSEASPTLALGRVLLVEDHPVNQAYARDALVSMGCRVDLANNGREAVEMFRAREYELVLMDCQMPELDGWEATRQIRAMEGAGKRVFIAALTAGAYEGDRERCLEAGMDDFLAKPFRIQDLKRLLERRSRS